MKLLLVLGVLTISLIYLRKQNVEPVVLSCCGNVRLDRDFKETDPDPPKKIERCLKSWGKPCTNIGSTDCCEGIDTCKPSHEGGKCRKRDGSGYYIYDSDGSKLEYTEDDEEEDKEERKRRRRRRRRRLLNEEVDDDDDDDDSETHEGIKNINYILAAVIGLTIIFLLGALVMYNNVGSDNSTTTSSSSSGRELLKKYETNKGFDKYRNNDLKMNFSSNFGNRRRY